VRRGAAQELVAGERERERELDTLRYEIAEIEAAGLTAGTTEHMKAEASRLEHAESIALASEELRALLDGEGAAIASIRQARAVLDKVVDKDRDLGPLVERLDSAIVELDDVIHEVAARVPIVDPELLEGIRQRLASLARLQRKYGGDDETVLDYLERARDKVARLELAALDVERSLREADEQERVALELAAELSSLRQEAAPRLAAEVGALLGELAMGSTRFEVTLVTSELYEGGSETVEMQVAAPGQALRPISKVASGGELSRIALALRLASGAVRGFASTTREWEARRLVQSACAWRSWLGRTGRKFSWSPTFRRWLHSLIRTTGSRSSWTRSRLERSCSCSTRRDASARFPGCSPVSRTARGRASTRWSFSRSRAADEASVAPEGLLPDPRGSDPGSSPSG
jgi:hypothetical protein